MVWNLLKITMLDNQHLRASFTSVLRTTTRSDSSLLHTASKHIRTSLSWSNVIPHVSPFVLITNKYLFYSSNQLANMNGDCWQHCNCWGCEEHESDIYCHPQYQQRVFPSPNKRCQCSAIFPWIAAWNNQNAAGYYREFGVCVPYFSWCVVGFFSVHSVVWLTFVFYCGSAASALENSAVTGMVVMSKWVIHPGWPVISPIARLTQNGIFGALWYFLSFSSSFFVFFSFFLHSSFANTFQHPFHHIRVQRWTDWPDTDSNHPSLERQADTLATHPQLVTVQLIFGTPS